MPVDLPPITKAAERCLIEVNKAVLQFSRGFRHELGADLRRQSAEVSRLCDRAWRDMPRQRYWTDQLVWAIDELKCSLRLGSQLHAFRSFAQFETLIRLAEDLGRQAGAWKRHQQRHPKGQSSSRSVAPERAQTLSTRAASAHAGANS
jgi:hypothetical protein